MSTTKFADELMPGDVFIQHYRNRGGPKDFAYRVLDVRPGAARATIQVHAISLRSGRRTRQHFFRVNRVELADE